MHRSNYLFVLALFTDDTHCKDYLQIVDVVYRKTIFRSCSESGKPVVITSDSNMLEVRRKFIDLYGGSLRDRKIVFISILGEFSTSVSQNTILISDPSASLTRKPNNFLKTNKFLHSTVTL